MTLTYKEIGDSDPPCEDLSPDPTNSFFAVGIHEELQNRLGSLSGLDVMECSARYAGYQMLPRTQLFDASDRSPWQEQFQVDLGYGLQSLFEIQANIAMNVANALRIAFLNSDRAAIEQVRTESQDAHLLYLAAVDAVPNYDLALDQLDEALAIDDGFVDAWIRRSSALNVRSGFRTAGQAAADRLAAIDAATRAVAIDRGYGRAYSALAAAFGQAGDWIDSEIAAERAVELGAAPGNPLVKLAVADFEDAVAQAESIVRLDPLNSVSAWTLLMAYQGLGEPDAHLNDE